MKCSECNKQFVRLSDLRKHCRKFHEGKVQDIAPLKRQQKTYEFTCHCGKNFNHKKHLNAHSKTHGVCVSEGITNTMTRKLKLKKCPMCPFENNKPQLHEHFETSHQIKIRTEELCFATFGDFEQWKNKMENETKAKYVKDRGAIHKENVIESNYLCHRSGFFEPEGRGIRHLKIQGSKKINGFCPSEMRVELRKNGQCVVKYTQPHVGHTHDLGHLSLTVSERKSVAVKIASKIPFPAILEEIRDNLTDNNLDRFDLLTKKDLYNIEAAYNLKTTAVRHQNDAISVDAWVNEMKEGSSCVLFYKQQDVLLEDYPDLKVSDFVLCIMNEGQTQVLRKFCNDCICIDGTHGLNNYHFEVHTLLVLDDLRQGFPCAFLISNRSDEAVLKLFFQTIKDRIGFSITPKVFMSDMAEVYYNAWLKVMDRADYRLFCTWHVLRAWKKNLSLISSKDKQQEIHTELRSLLEMTDQSAFTRMIDNFLIKTSLDPETSTFSSYFRDNYLKNVVSWAYCHRLYSGLNTNMHLERMHRTIKYVYLSGKNVKRLDKSINCLMRFVKDKLFDRIITLHKGKVSSKLFDLRSRHKSSLELKTDAVCDSAEGWEIPSTSKSFEVYNLQKNDISCDCSLRCNDCRTCIHQFSCSCLDSAVKWNMCKHIHLLCRYLESKLKEPKRTDDEDDDNLYIHHDSKEEESQNLVTAVALRKVRNGESVDEEKETLRRQFNEILDRIHTKMEIEALKKLMAPIDATLSAVSQMPNSQFPITSEKSLKIPANKNIVPQRRLYITKKCRNKMQMKKIEKISPEARDRCAIALLLQKNSL